MLDYMFLGFLLILVSLTALIVIILVIVLSFILKSKLNKKLFIPLFLVFIVLAISYFKYWDWREKYNSYFEKDCKPDMNKNKVAVVIANDGIYDTDSVNSQISKYYEAVKKDLNIDNAGIEKFDGKTIDELDEFVDEIYLNDGVGYIILLGDDLPIAEFQWSLVSGVYFPNASIEYITTKLQCVNTNCNIPIPLYSDRPEYCPGGPTCKGFDLCNDVAISFILPPVNYSDEKKVDFIMKIFKTYTDYHDNFKEVISRYQNTLFLIQSYYRSRERAETGGYVPDASRFDGYLGYNLSLITIFNNETQQVSNGLKNKHKILYLAVHGLSGIIEMGLHSTSPTGGQHRRTESALGIKTSLWDYSDFAKENGLPALFVESGACENYFVSGDGYCCWPEIFMESGVWAYYSFTASAIPFASDTTVRMREYFSSEQTLGLAIRKYAGRTPLSFFGDILAHIR